jgi:hypothetical protein
MSITVTIQDKLNCGAPVDKLGASHLELALNHNLWCLHSKLITVGKYELTPDIDTFLQGELGTVEIHHNTLATWDDDEGGLDGTPPPTRCPWNATGKARIASEWFKSIFRESTLRNRYKRGAGRVTDSRGCFDGDNVVFGSTDRGAFAFIRKERQQKTSNVGNFHCSSFGRSHSQFGVFV